MRALAKSQAEIDAEEAYKTAIKNVKGHSGPDRSAGPGYLKDLRTAVDDFKQLGGNVSTGESLLEGTGY